MPYSPYLYEFQRRTLLLGLYEGTLDGIYGGQTQSAANALVRDNAENLHLAELPLKDPNLFEENLASLTHLATKKLTNLPLPTHWQQPSDTLMGIHHYGELIGLKHPTEKACIAGQIWKETGGLLKPIKEGHFLSTQSRRDTFRKQLPYYPHFGYGLLQLTHAHNHSWASKLFTHANDLDRNLQPRINCPTNFLTNPEGLLDFQVSIIAAVLGMKLGIFRRNHCLNRYINPSRKKTDYYGARAIVNGIVPSVAKEIAIKCLDYQKYYETTAHETLTV